MAHELRNEVVVELNTDLGGKSHPQLGKYSIKLEEPVEERAKRATDERIRSKARPRRHNQLLGEGNLSEQRDSFWEVR